jgi:hypothetical protein
VIFGRPSGVEPNTNLSALDGANGFRLEGENFQDRAGVEVSNAGDVNGDGFGDLLIGAIDADASGSRSGAAYVVFGKPAEFQASIPLSGLNGQDGFRIAGAAAFDQVAYSLAAAGDVNGDGYDDIVLGSYRAEPTGYQSGASYVVFGKAAGFVPSLNLSTLDCTNGFRLEGVSAGDYAGFSTSGAGDINGDGFDDVVVGAIRANSGGATGTPSGAAYVIFGESQGFSASINLSELDGSNGFRLFGVAAYDAAGVSVSVAGDVNGDGYDDVIIGASAADPNGLFSGATYVVFGTSSSFASSVDLSTLDGSNGFRIDGAAFGDELGHEVSAAGDLNGDGYDDLVVGAFLADSNGFNSGAIYILLGKASGFQSSINLATLDFTDGFKLAGAAARDYAGISASGAGDVNGDGFADLIIGASGADPNGEFSGASYVVFGGDFNGAVDFPGTSGKDTLTGASTGETFVSGQGDDIVESGGGADVVRTGAGNDIIVVPNSRFADIDGGSGVDTLALQGGDRALNLAVLADNKVCGVERIDITGGGDNRLTLTPRDLFDLSDTTNRLKVVGDTGDTVKLRGTWDDGGSNGAFYVYTQGAATILVDADIFVV